MAVVNYLQDIFSHARACPIDLCQLGIEVGCVLLTRRSRWLPDNLPPPPQIQAYSGRFFNARIFYRPNRCPAVEKPLSAIGFIRLKKPVNHGTDLLFPF
jgi:hypothetical protein